MKPKLSDKQIKRIAKAVESQEAMWPFALYKNETLGEVIQRLQNAGLYDPNMSVQEMMDIYEEQQGYFQRNPRGSRKGQSGLNQEYLAVADDMLGDFWKWRDQWLEENVSPEDRPGVLQIFNQYMKV